MRTKEDKLFLSAVTITVLFFMILLVTYGTGVNAQSSEQPIINGNVLYMDPADRLYLTCLQCESIRMGTNEDGQYIEGVVYVAPFADNEPTETPEATATQTQAPLPTATSEPTATSLPTLEPTDEPTSTPLATTGCLDTDPALGILADYENYIRYDPTSWSLNFDSLDDDIERPRNVSKSDEVNYEDAYLGTVPFVALTNNDPLPFDSQQFIEWCFNPHTTGEFNLVIMAFTQGNQSDSVWVVGGETLEAPTVIKLPERQFSTHIAQRQMWNGNAGEALQFSMVEGEDFYLKIYPREDDTHIYALWMIPAGGQPVTLTPTLTPTAAVPTPSSGGGDYPPPATGYPGP